MGLLNHLFGSKKSLAKELVMDEAKRMKLWDRFNEHILSHNSREDLSRHFNFANVDKTLQDFERTIKILEQIEGSISPELVHIIDEEKSDEEILADLNRLKTTSEIEEINDEIVDIKQKESELIKIFQEILAVLKTELHLIKLIKKRPSNSRELLLKLFKIIFHQEAMLYKVFKDKTFSSATKHKHVAIMKIAKAIILGEEIKKELETAEEKFAKNLMKYMGSEESEHSYRVLGEKMYYALGGIKDRDVLGKDLIKFIENLDTAIRDDMYMYKIVKALVPNYTDIQIKGAILAFRETYRSGNFDTLEADFFT